jgi:hypothetical protein
MPNFRLAAGIVKGKYAAGGLVYLRIAHSHVDFSLKFQYSGFSTLP